MLPDVKDVVMSANPKHFLKSAAPLSADAMAPYPSARKVYVPGTPPDLRVGMREIAQPPTPSSRGEEANPPVTVYDTSGPYTDPAARIDLRTGLAPLREKWILERGDTAQLDGPSSEYGRARERDPKLASLRFEHIHKPRRAKHGANVSQMHYARQGIVTPEMEYIAIRETLRLNELRKDPRYAKLLRQHRGQNLMPAFPRKLPPSS